MSVNLQLALARLLLEAGDEQNAREIITNLIEDGLSKKNTQGQNVRFTTYGRNAWFTTAIYKIVDS